MELNNFCPALLDTSAQEETDGWVEIPYLAPRTAEHVN